jgi:hypothetical protein
LLVLAVYILTNKLLYCKYSQLLKINYCFYWSAIVVCFFFDFTRQVRKSQKLFWKKLALLVFVMNVITPTSGDYRLLNLFIPLAFFINESKSSKFDLAYLLLFGLLLIPKNYFITGLPPYINTKKSTKPLLQVASQKKLKRGYWVHFSFENGCTVDCI